MIFAIDTGGTKTLMATLGNDGQITHEFRMPTPQSMDDYRSQVLTAIREHFANVQPTAVIVAAPGMIVDNKIKWCANLPWRDFDVAAFLREVFPDAPILLENDANLAALGAVHALSQPVNVGLYLTFSTGVGAGVIIDGRISHDLRNIECGHMILEHVGQTDQWEKFASGRAFFAKYHRFGDEIFADETEVWHDFASNAAAGILALAPVIRPDVILIGGSMGTHFAKYGAILTDIIDRASPDFLERPAVVQADAPEKAVIHGAVIYARQNAEI